ncbi:unnamed protein product (macronuclear) [Paramecium tetraurelia]|uniref:Protein kinase domain-containing protein n=1 Tax=Paramecium tetraurelia TaxID=5888 RepID=A0BCD7_PARTE|nr:uncharacterized protein GSPATT00004298001 [Paramecium tetraurelia]CAK56204.1 unnamed protein product [Paramecium tetraurelia]|eukprot:XP_001423602.1 hypothetical protein (macronuclear) [Paramecium tetraurelia strain d4-2]
MSNQNDQHSNVEEHILKLYDIHDFKGKGAYGIVWKATDKQTKQQVALKKVFDAFQNSTDAQRTFREVCFLQQLTEHENIVKLLKVIPAENQKDLYMVFEYMETDLHKVIRAGLLRPLHMQYIIYQLLKCLKFIHSGELIHRDLKPSNLLIDSDCKVKVADFGLARSVGKSENLNELPIMTEYVATRWYRAPEILLGSHSYSKSVDMWSVGCILGEMILGKAIFSGASTLNQIEKIIELIGRPKQEDLEQMNAPLASQVLDGISMQKRKSFAGFFPNATPDFIDFIRQCLDWNPLKRMKIEEALKHQIMMEFANTEEEKTLKQNIKIPFNENKKLTIKDYRDKITLNCEQILQEIQQNIFDKNQGKQFISTPQSFSTYMSQHDNKNKQNVSTHQFSQPVEKPKRIDQSFKYEGQSVKYEGSNDKINIILLNPNKLCHQTLKTSLMVSSNKGFHPIRNPISKYKFQYEENVHSQVRGNCDVSKSPDIKKKTESSITNVTKSYSSYGEPYDKRSNNSSFITQNKSENKQNTSGCYARPIQVQQSSNYATAQSFSQQKDQFKNKEPVLINQAQRSKSFEKSPLNINPTSPYQRQKTEASKPKFIPQNNLTNNIAQVQKLLQKCCQVQNYQSHKKTTSFIDPQKFQAQQTINFNYYDARNTKFI